MISRLEEKLADPEYRAGYVESTVRTTIPFQIRAIQKARGWTQQELAQKAGMKQSRISAMQTCGSSHLTLTTLLRLAQAFDCGLLVQFVPFARLIEFNETFNPDRCAVHSYDEQPPVSKPKTRLLEFRRRTTVGRPRKSYETRHDGGYRRAS